MTQAENQAQTQRSHRRQAMSAPKQSRRIHWGLQWLLGVGLLFALVTAWANPKAVGQVMLAIGQTSVGTQAPIHIGDTLTTGEGGHLHIRFIDQGQLSLKPNSRLTITDYQYHPDTPNSGKVKFDLKQGTARSITGQAGQKNKSGYRMNTPIAAVGIRGTDFTTTAQAHSTQVSVTQGGIAITPYSDQCTPSGYGPCQGKDQRQLDADDNLQLMLIQKNDQIDIIEQPSAAQSSKKDTQQPTALAELLGIDETTIQDRGDQLGLNAIQQKAVDWGHWAYLKDTLSDQYQSLQALLGQNIIGMNPYMGLFSENDHTYAPRDQGRFRFHLTDYSAYSLTETGAQPAQIDQADLLIDLDSDRFATRFRVHNLQVNTQIQANGDIDRLGHFTQKQGDAISGSLINHNQQAGLVFEQQVDPDTKVFGATHWQQ